MWDDHVSPQTRVPRTKCPLPDRTLNTNTIFPAMGSWAWVAILILDLNSALKAKLIPLSFWFQPGMPFWKLKSSLVIPISDLHANVVPNVQTGKAGMMVPSGHSDCRPECCSESQNYPWPFSFQTWMPFWKLKSPLGHSDFRFEC